MNIEEAFFITQTYTYRAGGGYFVLFSWDGPSLHIAPTPSGKSNKWACHTPVEIKKEEV